MDFSIFDNSVSNTMNVFLVIGNIINLIYNIPQNIKTYKTKSTKDFSSTFLFMRVLNNSIWLAYSIELNTFLFLLSNIVSLFSSIFICYYKVIELCQVNNTPYSVLKESLIDDEKIANGNSDGYYRYNDKINDNSQYIQDNNPINNNNPIIVNNDYMYYNHTYNNNQILTNNQLIEYNDILTNNHILEHNQILAHNQIIAYNHMYNNNHIVEDNQIVDPSEDNLLFFSCD